MSENLENLENCCDYRHVNKSIITVRANILSLININGINIIQNKLKRQKTDQSTNDANKILDLCVDCGTKAIDFLNKSQSSITKRAVERYASHQHGMINNAFAFDEEHSQIEGISPNIVTPAIMDNYKKLNDFKHSFDTNSDEQTLNASSDSSNTMSDSSDRKMSDSNNTPDSIHRRSRQSELERYCLEELPRKSSKYYKPYDVAKLLYKHDKKVQDEQYEVMVNGSRASAYALMGVLISLNAVPLKKSALYRLIDLYRSNCLSPSDSWTFITQNGKKPFLSYSGFNLLVHNIREKSEGGLSIPCSKIRTMVEKRIIYEYQIKNKHNKIPVIHKDTLNDYTNKILAQDVFNINVGKIPYKTESRAAAEWSFRSAISYMCVVAVTHFLPNIEPSDYHQRKSEIPEESLVLWNLVETCYTKMMNLNKKVKVIPILPNLITSTDECTLFACPGKINKCEKIHVVAKPTRVKHAVVTSGSRNHYSTTPNGDAHCRGVRIVLNTTFTAGGLSAPIFVVVYGMGLDELPYDDMVTVRIKGLVAASDRNVLSQGDGFITSVRGNYETTNNTTNDESNNNNERDDTEASSTETHSKEARIAKLYRSQVYHPFIAQI